MNTKAALPTADEVLEEPLATEPAHGLVPRATLWWGVIIFIAVMVGFAIYDLGFRKPDVPVQSVEEVNKTKKVLAVDKLGSAPPPSDINQIAENQAAKVADAPLPAASMSKLVQAPADVSQAQRGVPSTGPRAEDQQNAQGSVSAIFAIAGGEGSTEGIPGAISKAADPFKEQIALLEKNIAQRSNAGSGGTEAEMVKALAGLQAQQGTARPGKDQQWLKDASGDAPSEATFAKPPVSPWMVFQGTRLPIVVREAVNSDLPGSITAMTTSPVFDSIQQCAVLIPTGTRLLGSYSADIRPGQSRVLMGFSRMVFPDGRSLNLNGAQGVDQIGAAGKEGEVNNHFLMRFGYSFALAMLSSSMNNNGASSITVGQNGQSTTTTIAGQVLNEVSSSILSRNASIPPTITLDVGSRLFVTLVRDLALPPVSRTLCK